MPNLRFIVSSPLFYCFSHHLIDDLNKRFVNYTIRNHELQSDYVFLALQITSITIGTVLSIQFLKKIVKNRVFFINPNVLLL